MSRKLISSTDELIQFLGEVDDNNRLYQYTTYDALLHILNEKRFRFSRSDHMNDKKEVELAGEKLFYLASFTSHQEYVSMWSMYGRPEEIKIRIDFPVKLFKRILVKSNIKVPIKTKGKFYTDQDGNLRVEEKEELVNYYTLSRPLFDIKNKEKIGLWKLAYYSKKEHKLKYNTRYFHDLKNVDDALENIRGLFKYDY